MLFLLFALLGRIGLVAQIGLLAFHGPDYFPLIQNFDQKRVFYSKKLQSNKSGMFPYIFFNFFTVKMHIFPLFSIHLIFFCIFFVFCSSTIRLFHFHCNSAYEISRLYICGCSSGSWCYWFLFFFLSCVGNLSGFIERCVLCNICVIMFNMVKSWGVECVRAHVCVCVYEFHGAVFMCAYRVDE